MDQVRWQLGKPTGNLAASYRGIRMVIKLGAKGRAIQIGWFIGGVLAESEFVSCDLDAAKKMSIDLIEQKIQTDGRWERADRERP